MSAEVNYNDGKWHGWNQGECPVHPKSEVEAVCLYYGNFSGEVHLAEDYKWDPEQTSAPIIAFRVTRVHREFFISNNDGRAYGTLEDYQRFELYPEHGYTYAVEVPEDN